MNTGADVSYLLKARHALNASEDAERIGNAIRAMDCAAEAIKLMQAWEASIFSKQFEKEAA